MNDLNVGDRVSTPFLTMGTVLDVIEVPEKPKFSKAQVIVDGQEQPQWYWVDMLRLYDPEAELERVIVRAEWSESSDALMLAAEIRALRRELAEKEAVWYIIVDKETREIDWDGELHSSVENAIRSMTGPFHGMSRSRDTETEDRTYWGNVYDICPVQGPMKGLDK